MHSTSAENLHHPATPPPTVRLHRSKTFSGRRETFLSDSQSSFLDDKLTSSPIHRMSKNERNSQLVSIIVSSDDEELEQKKRFIEQIPVAQQENKFDEKIPVQINKEKRNSSSSKSKRKKSSIVEKVNKTPSPSPYKNNSTISMKTEDSNNQKPFITVDISRARSNLEVVKLCLKELGWKESTSSSVVDADIYWHSTSFLENNPQFSSASGRVNKFPSMSELLRKIHLTRSLNHMRVLFPHEYNFYPQTWFLPEQDQQFKDDVRYIHQQDRKHHRSLTTFIVKPSDGSQGEGIYLLRDPAHMINTSRPHVIQEYIDRPLLIDGLKFDLRIYVLILNLYPLEIYLYEEGLVRFATVDYKAPSTENLHQTYMHLTNYSLNKRSATYKHASNDQQNDGSKRKLTGVWQQLTETFGAARIEKTKSLIIELINKTIIAIVPEMRVEYQNELPSTKPQTLSCFQIVGFDIILDDQLKPILLEVNSNPSLRIDFDKPNENGKIVFEPSPIDEEIKKPLVLESLKLALPKKKLETIARHVQTQEKDEVLAQRLEKLAKQRVEERSEKLRSARLSRFDIKTNPFFSRPIDSPSKEVERQTRENQRFKNPTTFHSTVLLRFHDLLPTTFDQKSVKSSSKSQSQTSTEISSFSTVSEENRPIVRRSSTRKHSSKRQTPMSASLTSANAETSLTTSVKYMKLIFPWSQRKQYDYFFLIDQISFVFIQTAVLSGSKTMSGGQFRNFAILCGIINETITASSIDILYYQILRKWQHFVLRNTSTGLPFPAFVEAFFSLSQRKYPNAESLLDSVNRLAEHSVRNLNSAIGLTSLTSSSILSRSTKTSASLAARRSPKLVSASASPILTEHRNRLLSQSPTISVNHNLKPKSATKSVFPLFFDVL